MDKKQTFFWQGLLILLPLVVLAGVGVLSLRQEGMLAEHQARERCAEVAEALATLMSKDLFNHAREMVFDLRSAASSPQGRKGHFCKPAWFPAEKIEASIPAPRYDELVLTWTPTNNLSQRRLTINADSVLLDDKGDRPLFPFAEPVLTPLSASALSPSQAQAWQTASDAEFLQNPLSECIKAYQDFLALMPPEPFAINARYSLGLLLARQGPPELAQKIFRELELLPEAATESGLPIAILAQWQLAKLAVTRSSGSLATNAEIATALESLCSNAVASGSIVAPLILNSVKLMEDQAGMHAKASSSAMAQWQYDEAARNFIHGAKKQIVQGKGLPRAFWLDWDGRQWLVLATPGPSSSLSNGVARVHAFYDLLLQESLWEILIKSRTPLPDYAGVSISLAGKTAYNEKASGKILASSLANWSVNGVSMKGLTVDIHLAEPSLLYAQQHRRTVWFALLVLVSAMAAMIGYIMAYRAFHQQLRLSEMKSNFVSAVSHELRAPIASVRLLAEGLDRGKISGELKQKEYFRFIVQECRRLSSLIENVLDFSRIEQGRKRYQFAPADVLALGAQTVKLMSPNAQERQVTLRLESAHLSPEHTQLNCDSLAVQQALINLIDNAIKHSPSGAVVTVGIESCESPAPLLRLWVEDQGPGIPAEDHERIFERFYRRGSELRRETQGIGIGLSIVKHVIEAHGGRVLVRSDVGQGSRFTMEFKIVGATDNKHS